MEIRSHSAMFARWSGIAAIVLSGALHASAVPAWIRSWDAPSHHADEIVQVRRAGAKGVLALGRAYSTTLGYQRALLRYEPDGTRSWAQVDATPTVHSPDLVVDADGWAYYADIGSGALTVRKFDSVSGTLAWERTRAVTTSNDAMALSGPKVAVDPADGRVRVAFSHADDFVVATWSADGVAGVDAAWAVADSVDVPTSLAIAPDGGFVVAGYEGGVFQATYRVVGFDAQGVVRFDDAEAGSHGSLFTPVWVAVGADGTTTVVGGPETPCGLFEFRIWKLDANGDRLWSTTWPPTTCKVVEPIGFSLLADGSSIVVSSIGGSQLSVGVTRVGANGVVHWDRHWGGTVAGVHRAVPIAFAVDASQNTRVVGFEYVGGSSSRYVVAEWGADGGVCVAGSEPIYRGTAIDVLGDGWVGGGYGEGPVGTTDTFVLRYPAAASCDVDALFADTFQ